MDRLRLHQDLLRKGKASDLELEPIAFHSNSASETNYPGLSPFDAISDEFIDLSKLDIYGIVDASVNPSEIAAQVQKLQSQFADEYSAQFFTAQRDSLISTVADRFFLGGLMSKGDKDGGPVDTIHNVRNGTWATDEARAQFERRGDYNSTEYHTHENYIETNRKTSTDLANGKLTDSYTGKVMDRNQHKDLDHVIAAKEIHDDAGRVLANLSGAELANQDTNLAATDQSINRSKKQKSVDEFTEYLSQTADQRNSRIVELESKNALSEKERGELSKLKKLGEADPELLAAHNKEARKAYEDKLNRTYYCSPEFIGNLAKTSAIEGAKMGFRQIIGTFLTEAIAALFDEIRDACKEGVAKGKDWWRDVQDRLARIIERVKSKWQEALGAGFQGLVSGVFSNIVTVLINAFTKLAAGLVRLVREGFFSLLKAVQLLMNPPVGMSRSRLLHEVGKLIVTGIVVAIGILVEEGFKTLPPVQAIASVPVVGELLVEIFFGLLTGLAASLALWAWDKMDLFGAKLEDQHAFVMEALSRNATEERERREAWLAEFAGNNPEYHKVLVKEIGF